MPATIQLGAQGQEVEQLQYLLARRQILDHADIDGSFGPKTQQAVEDFQAGSGLTVDGIVGPATWASLLTGYDIPPVLEQGSTGADVGKLQAALNTGRSAWDPVAPALAVDDDFGPQTRNMVVAFQNFAGTYPDGIVGYRTWASPVGAAGLELAGLAGV